MKRTYEFINLFAFSNISYDNSIVYLPTTCFSNNILLLIKI